MRHHNNRWIAALEILHSMGATHDPSHIGAGPRRMDDPLSPSVFDMRALRDPLGTKGFDRAIEEVKLLTQSGTTDYAAREARTVLSDKLTPAALRVRFANGTKRIRRSIVDTMVAGAAYSAPV